MNRLIPSRGLTHLIKPSIRPQLSTSCHLRVYYNTLQPQEPQLLQRSKPSHQFRPQKRTFLSSFIPTPPQSNTGGNGNGNGNGGSGKGRTLTATRTLPYTPKPLFNVISTVESYADFLPFLTSSTVTARDPETDYPTQAHLTVGYGPVSETFTSAVECDDKKWVVEARSGEKFVNAPSGGESKSGLGALAGLMGAPGADEGIFEYLSTRWELVPEVEGQGCEPRTTVKLEIRFEFKNQWYASMMGAIEGQMAGIMIEAFEARVQELYGR